MVPEYLNAYADLYAEDPRAAALAWFQDAKYGLFMHYGVYSLLGRGEWVMLREAIPVAEYEQLKAQFTARNFDADFIADMAVDAGMKYVNITTRHHDSFCLFETKQTDFNSVDAPAGRDLVAELAEACRKRDLGLFFYYSYGLDWRHPFFLPREAGWPSFRPAYASPDPAYRFEKEADFQRYIDFVHNQIRELLTQYGPVAGMWFDPIMPYYFRPDMFPLAETYALIRSLQPRCLIAFKNGANGDEDFASPERDSESLVRRLKRQNPPDHALEIATQAWNQNQDNPRNEICDTLTNRHWGYSNQPDVVHRQPDDVMKMLANAEYHACNLLLNTGPLPEGGIDPVDEQTLRTVGKQLRESGFPEPAPIDAQEAGDRGSLAE